MSFCQRCQQNFTCAMADDTGEPCWCIALPKVAMPRTSQGNIDLAASCYCPTCLPIWQAEMAKVKTPDKNGS